MIMGVDTIKVTAPVVWVINQFARKIPALFYDRWSCVISCDPCIHYTIVWRALPLRLLLDTEAASSLKVRVLYLRCIALIMTSQTAALQNVPALIALFTVRSLLKFVNVLYPISGKQDLHCEAAHP